MKAQKQTETLTETLTQQKTELKGLEEGGRGVETTTNTYGGGGE